MLVRRTQTFLLAACAFAAAPFGCSDATGGGSAIADVADTEAADTATSDLPDTSAQEPPPIPVIWQVEVSAAAEKALGWTSDDVVFALTQMGRKVTRVGLTARQCTKKLGLVRFVAPSEAADPGLSTDQSWRIREARCEEGGRLVTLEGGGLLGRQYAAYDFLHRIGARFFHPEEEWYPPLPMWPEAPFDVERTPFIRWRSASLHLTHPLELGDVFRRGKPEYELEGKRYIDWQVKNLASYGQEGVLSGDYARYGLERGFLRSAGLSLYGQQQGASGLIDPDSPLTAEEQLAAAIDEQFALPDVAEFPIRLFSVGFQPTEFTTEPEDEVVAHLRFIAEYLEEKHPEVMPIATFHATSKPPSEKYGVSPYALMVPAHERWGVNVHTLMFYDLERPAPVYGNENFNYLEDFMREHAGERRFWYFPESAWWLTFDLPVPLYLPITIEARSRDLTALADLVDTTWQYGEAAAADSGLDGHRIFGSGHEWGYWQNEYCAFRMAADRDVDWRDCLADITTPFGEAQDDVLDVLDAVIAHQETVFFDAEMLRYLVGTDAETEAAAALGVVFHPLPPTPEAVFSWDEAALTTWEQSTRPRLVEMAGTYAALVQNLATVEDWIPETGGSIFREIRDGIEVTGLRARHAAELFGALAARRRSILSGAEDTSAAGLAAAQATTQAAIAVIHRREADYRYEPLERSIGGGETLDGDENWTIYPYRYLGRTHWGFYWTAPDRRVADALAGAASDVRVQVKDALVPAGQAHELTFLAASPGGALDWGDGADDTVPMGATSRSHSFAVPGLYVATATLGGAVETFALGTLATETFTGKTATAVSPAGVSIIDPLLPALVYGELGAPTSGQAQVALGFARDDAGTVAPTGWRAIDLAGGAGIETVPTDLTVPIMNGTELLAEIGLVGAVFRVPPGEAPRISGALKTDELVLAVVEVGGFEPEGARSLIASLLGLTPETLPDVLDFEVRWPLPE